MLVKKTENKRIPLSKRLNAKNESFRYKDYIREKEEKEIKKEAEEEQETVDFTNPVVLTEIKKVINDIELVDNKNKLSKDTLIFKYKDKDGSIKRNGYMLCLNIDGIDPINHPVRNLNSLSITNLIDAVKALFKKYKNLAKTLENYKSCKKEDHCITCIDGVCKPCGDFELSKVKEPLFYILIGDKQNPSTNIPVLWNEVVGDENGYKERSEAILVARDLFRNDPQKAIHAYCVVGKVAISYFIDNTFWDALDNEEIPLVWNSSEDQALQDDFPEEVAYIPAPETDMDTDSYMDVGFEASEDYKNPVFLDVAKTKLLEKLKDSLLIASSKNKEKKEEDDDILEVDDFSDMEDDKEHNIMLYLSPSYAINPLSTIMIPVSFEGGIVSMPMADIPDPEVVFDGEYTENAIKDYDEAIQNYILKDVSKSDIIELNLDNIDDVKARIIEVINSMSEDYQDKRSKLENLLDITGESLLKEARYYLISSDDDPKTMDDVKKITPMGFTDLNIARDSIKDFAESGKYDNGLVILDTHFSNNNEKWEIL